jgi:heme-degrading monooxygenase HmoA
MDQQMATTLRPGGEPAHAGSRWKTHEQNQPRSYWEGQGLNSRAVEFIAKAGMSSQLRDCFDGPVLKFLEGLMGFRGTLVLTPHQEPRRILVLSFWKTERHCRETEWELADQVQEEVGPLIDTFSRVRTYKAEGWSWLEPGQSFDAAQPC